MYSSFVIFIKHRFCPFLFNLYIHFTNPHHALLFHHFPVRHTKNSHLHWRFSRMDALTLCTSATKVIWNKTAIFIMCLAIFKEFRMQNAYMCASMNFYSIFSRNLCSKYESKSLIDWLRLIIKCKNEIYIDIWCEICKTQATQKKKGANMKSA